MRAFACLSLLALAPLGAQSVAPAARTDPAGFSTTRLKRLDAYLDSITRGNGPAVGAVMVVARNGRIVYEHAAGMADREAKRPMTPTTLFRIASQSKALTSVAAMMLVEEGRLALGDPVSKFVPDFGAGGVATLADSAGTRVRRIERTRRPVTVRDLLTHMSGFSYGVDSLVRDAYQAQGLGPAAGFGWYFADKTEPICASIERLGKLPAVAQPGERWVYGYSTDALGCVVERASGQTLAEFFRTRITEPLGMRDTRFCVPEAERARLAAVYTRAMSGAVERAADGARGQGSYVASPCRAYSGGAGLVSTARDYARFLSMLAARGSLDGARLLAPATVDLMASDVAGPLYTVPGMTFGLGFEVVREPGRAGRMGPAGQFGWGGAYGSTYWVDPANGIVGAFMTQLFGEDVRGMQERVRNLVYQALER